jgi:endonuclease/exonuclease/phosphatase family metal-dependent hydrolase
MEEVEADVWVLTESWANACLLPGYRLVSQSCEAVDLSPARRWVAIWSKGDAETVEVLGQPDRMACASIKSSMTREVLIVGTVLPWKFDVRWPNTEGFCAALDIQQTEWRRLANSAPTRTLVLAGDFNQSLPHQRYYGSQRNEIALNAALESQELRCVTPGNDSLTGIPRIDHICVHREALQSLVASQIGTWPIPEVRGKPVTDHSGVYIDWDDAP